MADDALDRLRIAGPLVTAPLLRAPLHLRRAAVLAAALATGARVLVLEDPFAGLPEDAGRLFSKVVVRALDELSWMLFAPRVAFSSPAALHADEAVVVAGSEVIGQGAPAEIAAGERTFNVRLYGEAAAFARLAAARGATVASATGGALTLDLGALSTADLFAIAEEARAVIVELCPLARAFQ
jgi:hypothetical protein